MFQARRTLALLAPLAAVAACTGDPLVELCLSAADCVPPSLCREGVCRRACVLDADCYDGVIALQRAQACVAGACVPCPGGRCRPEPEPEPEPPAERETPPAEREAPPDAEPSPDAEPAPDADADPEPPVDRSDTDPAPDADPQPEGELWPDREPEPEPDEEPGPDLTGTCDPLLDECPPGHACVRLLNHASFPPACQDAVEDGTFDGNCYACRPECDQNAECADHESCVGPKPKTCQTLWCDSWRDYQPAMPAAAARITERQTGGGSRTWTLTRGELQIGDVPVVGLASSLCQPVGTDADFEVTLVASVDLPPTNQVATYEIAGGASLYLVERDNGWCEDRWRALTGKLDVLVLAEGGAMSAVFRATDVSMLRDDGPDACLRGESIRDVPRILLAVGPRGRRGASQSCDVSSPCRDGHLCSPLGDGMCMPVCDLGVADALASGCESGTGCVHLGAGSPSALDAGGCLALP